MCPPKLVRCWNCKHLKTIYQGEPKDGKLFAKKIKQCTVHGLVLEKYLKIIKKRECNDHVKIGIWEAPPTIQP